MCMGAPPARPAPLLQQVGMLPRLPWAPDTLRCISLRLERIRILSCGAALVLLVVLRCRGSTLDHEHNKLPVHGAIHSSSHGECGCSAQSMYMPHVCSVSHMQVSISRCLRPGSTAIEETLLRSYILLCSAVGHCWCATADRLCTLDLHSTLEHPCIGLALWLLPCCSCLGMISCVQ